ncbi:MULTISPECIES: VCBS domain-containing protein [unclassified Bradyrhizobium]|uniref:VCBS domain-containing protein n=1 Tax=unclassified Bradyrhizobium TaxID=2631580 RepID=UPI002FF2B2EF
MLWLTALTFSLVKKVQAADPNITFLDDGNITYKDLEHGAFELVTKEVIPRHFLVEDPGQTVVLRSQGSSISVAQITNSAARMAELQAAQQDALATFEKGLGSTGSSTPPPLERLPVQPINFIQIDRPPPAQDLPALPPSIFASVPETIFGQLPPPQPSPPTLTAVLGPTETDTVVFDVFAATSGTFLASSPNSGATLTFGIDGGIAGSTVIDGVTYDVSRVGPYGTLYVDSTTGAYTFVPDSNAINALTAPTTTDFTITVSDGTLSADQTFTIAINGTNDAAIISGTTSGAVIEASGAANTALGTPSATGTLTNTDVDDAPNTFTPVSAPTASARGFGTFTMTANGVWAYTIDQANSAVQALNVGDTLTDTFTVTTIDGTAQMVTVTIHGANDAAVISGATTGSVTEDSGANCDKPTATGTLTDTDVDNTPNRFTAVSCPTASDGGYGTFTMTADGVWTYKLDDANCVVQALDVGDTLTDTFTVTTIDGTAQVVTITIHGASDADPNDFDYLATGNAVICDPPYVYGTPRGDSIAGGGDRGQIIYGGAGNDTINGTGKSDLIYAGSGDDTVKGNDGDDKIYGGSGSDTINGNNGCDTIIGGYGADNLRGGNGDDRFVYLSAADSNAARFDVITDFRSGSDRIDLTALAALAFLALTSASTSVPAHTVAWFYDGTTNQTILFVNPTAQVLDIGDSALLEVHLEGLVTVQASDFVPEPKAAPVVVAAEPISPELAATAETDDAVTTVAADASLDGPDGDGAHVNGGSWALRTAWNGDHFDFSRFDEARTQPTESTHDDGAVTLTSGPSLEPQRIHLTAPADSDLALDQTSTHDAVVHTTSSAMLDDDRDAPRRIAHDRTPDSDDWLARSSDDWSLNSVVHSSIRWNNEDHGRWDDYRPPTMEDADDAHVDGHGHHWGSSALNRHSTASQHGAHDFEPTIADAAFGSATLRAHGHGDSFHFKDKISVLDVSSVADVDHASASVGHGGYIAKADEPPAISEPAQAIEMASSSHHAPDSSEHHWFDNISSGPNHAWSGASSHAPHDLMV